MFQSFKDKQHLFVLVIIVISTFISSLLFYIYQMLYTPNILVDQPPQRILIENGQTFADLQRQFARKKYMTDLVSFSVLAKVFKYHKNVKPGYYVLESNMGNLALVQRLRKGEESPVNITFRNIRHIEEIPHRIKKQSIGMDKHTLAVLITSDSVAQSFGFTRETFISMFIPNTYQIYYTTSPQQFLLKMYHEYKVFWNENRLKMADSIGLTPLEVSVLASIVKAETYRDDEKPRIAGVYMNRMRKTIPLQADPTLIFAHKNYAIKRVLNKHKDISSPYNTYKNLGLPPGPINMPDIKSIDAVLQYERHKYIYFCAKEDFSGYHNFATNLKEHNKNAEKYQKALKKARIFK